MCVMGNSEGVCLCRGNIEGYLCVEMEDIVCLGASVCVL